MAQSPTAQPRVDFDWIVTQNISQDAVRWGKPAQVYAQYMASLDTVVRALCAGLIGPLTQVAAPSNANAALAGIAVGGLYTTTADPHIVYIRTA